VAAPEKDARPAKPDRQAPGEEDRAVRFIGNAPLTALSALRSLRRTAEKGHIMSDPDSFITTDDGLLTDGEGMALATFVDSFKLLEMHFPEASVILLRLFEKETSAPGQPVSAREANQVRMSAQSARRLAELLNQAADDLEGRQQPRQ
jgi:hypothetical protein